jgi:hypothetical protein
METRTVCSDGCHQLLLGSSLFLWRGCMRHGETQLSKRHVGHFWHRFFDGHLKKYLK